MPTFNFANLFKPNRRTLRSRASNTCLLENATDEGEDVGENEAECPPISTRRQWARNPDDEMVANQCHMQFLVSTVPSSLKNMCAVCQFHYPNS